MIVVQLPQKLSTVDAVEMSNLLQAVAVHGGTIYNLSNKLDEAA